MKTMDVKWVSPELLIPYANNAKKHPQEQIDRLANGIKAFGWTQPIVIDKNNVVVIGHGRLLASKQLGLESVPVVMRDDLSEDEINACRLEDNKTNESDWDFSKLEEELASLAIAGIDMTQFGFDAEAELDSENPYTQKTDIPQYEVTGEDVEVSDLYQNDKTKELLAEINSADIPEEVKAFLSVASYRHVIFNYQKIAEYYAKADKKTQELMEKSALVIIDIDDAIKNGYTLLRDDITELIQKEMEYE